MTIGEYNEIHDLKQQIKNLEGALKFEELKFNHLWKMHSHCHNKFQFQEHQMNLMREECANSLIHNNH